jgi:hypothetical protein
VLPAIVDSSRAFLVQTGVDIFPEQIATELHYITQMPQLPWMGRDKSPGEIFQLFNYLFFQGGYVLADRHDNEACKHCSEILLVHAVC